MRSKLAKCLIVSQCKIWYKFYLFQLNWKNLKFGFKETVKIILLFTYLCGWSCSLFCHQYILLNITPQCVFIQCQIIGITALVSVVRTCYFLLCLLLRYETAFRSVELTFGNSQCSVCCR